MSAVLVASGDSPGLGNGVYTVFVEDQPDADGRGTFTIATGQDHPAGEGQGILLNRDGIGDAATSYLTVRSYTTGVDYVQTTADVYSANIVYPLDPLAVITTTEFGYLSAYDLTEHESLHIESAVSTTGSTFADAAVTLGATVRNDSEVPLQIGLRYLLDLAPGSDDGPRLYSPAGPEGTSLETTFDPAPSAVNIAPNDFGAANVEFAIRGDGPSTLLKYAAWDEASASAFDYTTDGQDVASPSGLNDSAVLYYFGSTAESAIAIAPGASITVEVRIVAPRPFIELMCENGSDEDGDTLVDGADPDCPGFVTPTPVPGTPLTPTPAVTPKELPNTGGRRR